MAEGLHKATTIGSALMRKKTHCAYDITQYYSAFTFAHGKLGSQVLTVEIGSLTQAVLPPKGDGCDDVTLQSTMRRNKTKT